MGPHANYNAYRDYNDIETDAQIIAMAMTYFDMKNIDGKTLTFNILVVLI